MIKIFYDNEQFVVLVDGEQNSKGIIELDPEKTYVLTLLPIYDKTLFLPISSTAKIKNDNLICSVPYIKIDTNQYFFTPNFAPYLPPVTPHVDIQREFGEHTITIYTDNLPKLIVENKSHFITVLIGGYPEKIQEAVLDNGVLFYCLCKKYLCVIFYDYNDYTLLIDKECDSYEFDDSGVTIKVKLNDNQGRVYTSHLTFDGKDYVCDKENFEYLSPHTPHEKLLGYDFLQAVLAEDYEYCKQLLSPTCPLSIEQIEKMFENATDIIIPNIFLKPGVYYLATKTKPITCKLTFEGNLVSNIAFW